MIPLTAATQMDPRQEEIFAFCEKYFFEHENPVLVIKNSRFQREGYDAFGLTEPQLKELRDMVFERFQPSVPELARLAPHFFATGKYEFGTLAIMFLKKHRPRFDRTVYEELRKVLDNGVDNWAQADLIGKKLTPVLLELGIATLEEITGWMSAESRWTRRVAAVTLLFQRSRPPVGETLPLLKPLMTDRDRVVQQGLGWVLREFWKIAPREVEDFLFENKDTASRMIIQYATEKMNKDKKKRFRRSVGGQEQPNQEEERSAQPEARPPAPAQQQRSQKPRHLIPRRKPRYRKPVPSKEDNHE